MEIKNLILAVALCLVVLFGWGHFAEYMGWVKPAPPEQARRADQAPLPPPAPDITAPLEFKPSPGKDFKVDTPLYEAVFYTGGGQLKSFILKKYTAGILPDSPLVNMIDPETAKSAPLGLVIDRNPTWSTGQWQLEGDIDELRLGAGEKGSFTLSGRAGNFLVKRQFSINADTYLVREKLTITNEAAEARTADVTFRQAMDASHSSANQYDSMRIAWDENGKLDDETSASTLAKADGRGVRGIKLAQGRIWWAGPMSTYFLAAVLPEKPDGITVIGLLEGTVYRVGVETERFQLAPGQSATIDVSYWNGPKQRAEMEAVSDQLAKSIDLGFFSIIARALLWLLEFIHQYFSNWGVAIILLTVVIKALFWPLSAKSYASMEKMKQLAPQMQAIREKYKDNRQQLNKEMMELYKSRGVNPASGCLPILVQIPVFFGLYQALLTSIALRHASFISYLPGTDIVWLADLSAKDPLYITPIVMGLTMFLQQKMSPPPAEPMQRRIMMFLPLVFTLLFLNFPAGLVLYWLTNNVLSILQQWLMMRKNKKAKPKNAS